jgi:hypothetical protein
MGGGEGGGERDEFDGELKFRLPLELGASQYSLGKHVGAQCLVGKPPHAPPRV